MRWGKCVVKAKLSAGLPARRKPARDVALRILAALLLFGFLWALPVPIEQRLRLCGFQWLTGRPCPLCGLTRGLFALAKGHWHDALALNALSPVGFLMIFGGFWKEPVRGRLWAAGVGAFALYGFWRLV